ncbi:ribonuclease D [Oscillatoria sp. FACHB-1406]|uniref:ribonuclease D n=1 Tax=Oscillatoria sp. FACHB-1406 TaxID=2692846 RepID=UPI001682F422|nr:ribonuclease D [Oscillatoria sp. FACHB-1406]MBD2579202.1 ribonuclease D [Oscillatoria sp. FACHB-1406]
MAYLTDLGDIKAAIVHFRQRSRLWLDTEVADFRSQKPRLSLIQVLDDPSDETGDRVTILDVLDCPDAIALFIEQIMLDPEIEKVFHNAKYDLKFLGKQKAKQVTCTLELAKKIPYYLAPVNDYTLKTLAEKLCNLPAIDKTEQQGDWGQRPLTSSQLHYAKMDVVYLTKLHRRLLELQALVERDPETENLEALLLRYRQIEHQWQCLSTEMEHLRTRIKATMQHQEVEEQAGFKLSMQKRTTRRISFQELARFARETGADFDLSIALNKNQQTALGEYLEVLPIEEEVSAIAMLKVSAQDEEDIPF